MPPSTLPSNPAIGWIGTGALGLLYSAHLARAGIPIHLFLRSDYEHARSHGIALRTPDRTSLLIPPSAFHSHLAGHPPANLHLDLIVLTTKTTSNSDLPALLAPLVKPHTALLTLQNGLGNEALLASLYPNNPILGGTAFTSVHRIAPAQIDHQHGGRIAIGSFQHSPPSLVESIASLLRLTGFPIDVLPSLNFGRWEKQLWNVPFNSLGAALQADTQQLLASESGLSLLRGIMREVCKIAALDGVRLPDDMAEHKIQYTFKMGAYRTSMQIDRELGREMEIDSIVTSVLRIARKNNAEAPLISTVETMLHAVDTAKRSTPLTQSSRD